MTMGIISLPEFSDILAINLYVHTVKCPLVSPTPSPKRLTLYSSSFPLRYCYQRKCAMPAEFGEERFEDIQIRIRNIF